MEIVGEKKDEDGELHRDNKECERVTGIKESQEQSVRKEVTGYFIHGVNLAMGVYLNRGAANEEGKKWNANDTGGSCHSLFCLLWQLLNFSRSPSTMRQRRREGYGWAGKVRGEPI